MHFSFKDVEQALASTFAIAEDKRLAFAARLKHLRRIGFPEGTNPGRGKIASYDPGQVFMLLVGVELAQLGYLPEQAKRLANDNRIQLALAAIAAAEREPERESYPNPIILVITPSGLADLATDAPAKPIEQGRLSAMSDRFIFDLQNQGVLRLAFSNLSVLLQSVADHLVGSDKRAAFYAALFAWATPIAAEMFEDLTNGDD